MFRWKRELEKDCGSHENSSSLSCFSRHSSRWQNAHDDIRRRLFSALCLLLSLSFLLSPSLTHRHAKWLVQLFNGFRVWKCSRQKAKAVRQSLINQSMFDDGVDWQWRTEARARESEKEKEKDEWVVSLVFFFSDVLSTDIRMFINQWKRQIIVSFSFVSTTRQIIVN